MTSKSICNTAVQRHEDYRYAVGGSHIYCNSSTSYSMSYIIMYNTISVSLVQARTHPTALSTANIAASVICDLHDV